jgi:hypothetical protein
MTSKQFRSLAEIRATTFATVDFVCAVLDSENKERRELLAALDAAERENHLLREELNQTTGGTVPPAS